MSDIMSILQSSYAAGPQSLFAPGSKFANVDPTQWQGTWTGTDDKNQAVTMSISKVSGFRANVTAHRCIRRPAKSESALSRPRISFESATPCSALTGPGKGTLTTIVTDPTTGNQSKLTVPLTLKT